MTSVAVIAWVVCQTAMQRACACSGVRTASVRRRATSAGRRPRRRRAPPRAQLPRPPGAARRLPQPSRNREYPSVSAGQGVSADDAGIWPRHSPYAAAAAGARRPAAPIPVRTAHQAASPLHPSSFRQPSIWLRMNRIGISLTASAATASRSRARLRRSPQAGTRRPRSVRTTTRGQAVEIIGP